jgi:hypothetical protein
LDEGPLVSQVSEIKRRLRRTQQSSRSRQCLKGVHCERRRGEIVEVRVPPR